MITGGNTSLSPAGEGETKLKTIFAELDTAILWRKLCNCLLVMCMLMCAKQCYWKELIPWISKELPLLRLWTQLCIHVSGAAAGDSSSCTGYLRLGFCIGQNQRITLIPFLSPALSWLHIVNKSQPAQNVQVLEEKPCRTYSHSLSESGASKLQQNSGHLYSICGWCMVASCIKLKSYIHTCNTLLSTLWSITLHIYFCNFLRFQKV